MYTEQKKQKTCCVMLRVSSYGIEIHIAGDSDGSNRVMTNQKIKQSLQSLTASSVKFGEERITRRFSFQDVMYIDEMGRKRN